MYWSLIIEEEWRREEFDNKQEKENTTRIVQIIIAIQINISIIIIQLQLQLHKREDDSELRDIRI